MVAGQYKLGKEEYTKRWRISSNAKSLSKEYKNEAALKWHRNNPEKYLLKSARTRAKRDNKEFNLDISDILIPEFCPALGIRLTNIREGGKPRATTPSLDRKDNSIGYIKGNVFVISWRANQLKSNMSIDEMKGILEYALPSVA